MKSTVKGGVMAAARLASSRRPLSNCLIFTFMITQRTNLKEITRSLSHTMKNIWKLAQEQKSQRSYGDDEEKAQEDECGAHSNHWVVRRVEVRLGTGRLVLQYRYVISADFSTVFNQFCSSCSIRGCTHVKRHVSLYLFWLLHNFVLI